MNSFKLFLMGLLLVGCVTQAQQPQELKMEDINVGEKLLSAQPSTNGADCDMTVANLLSYVPADQGGQHWVPLKQASQGQFDGMVCGIIRCSKDGQERKIFDCAPVQLFKKKPAEEQSESPRHSGRN